MTEMLSVGDLIQVQEHQIRLTQYPKMTNPGKMPVLVNGGVGDVIMNIPVVSELFLLGPIEIFTQHVSTFNHFKPDWVQEAKKAPIPDYTWFLEINTICRFHWQNGFSKILPDWEWLWVKQQKLLDRDPFLRTVLQNHPLMDSSLARYARARCLDRVDFPFFSLDIPRTHIHKNDRAIPEKYITIHDGYEIASAPQVRGRATKLWKWEYWNQLVRELKRDYPDYKILQLGTNTARPIDGVDECWINQTTLIQAFEILKHSALHIDGDSGLAHAATALQVPCVVMFGPTPDYFYGYKQNENIRASTCVDACYWIKKDWLSQCPIGYNAPKCMDDISVEEVMERVRKRLPRSTREPLSSHVEGSADPSHQELRA